MRVKIERDGEHLTNAEVEGIEAIPGMLWAASGHYGNGEFICRSCDDVPSMGIVKNDRIFRLETEWIEEGE
jgi:hypothetical protein